MMYTVANPKKEGVIFAHNSMAPLPGVDRLTNSLEDNRVPDPAHVARAMMYLEAEPAAVSCELFNGLVVSKIKH